jgi:hypothetical protein
VTDERTAWCNGLRELADFIEARPDFGEYLPRFDACFFAHDREVFASLVRRLGGGEKGSTPTFFEVARRFGPHKLSVNAYHDQVCERVVVGTEEVEVPDPETPRITVEREVVEWRCPDSILQSVEQEQAA